MVWVRRVSLKDHHPLVCGNLIATLIAGSPSLPWKEAFGRHLLSEAGLRHSSRHPALKVHLVLNLFCVGSKHNYS